VDDAQKIRRTKGRWSFRQDLNGRAERDLSSPFSRVLKVPLASLKQVVYSTGRQKEVDGNRRRTNPAGVPIALRTEKSRDDAVEVRKPTPDVLLSKAHGFTRFRS
jgi:hypothetical protein